MPRAMLFAASALTIVLGGCTAEPAATSTTAEPDLTVSLFEWGFAPSRITAEPESMIQLRLRNDGSLEHDLAVLSSPIEAESDLESVDVIAAAHVEAGAVALLEIDTARPGTYQIICSISGHFSQGMEGQLVVAP